MIKTKDYMPEGTEIQIGSQFYVVVYCDFPEEDEAENLVTSAKRKCLVLRSEYVNFAMFLLAYHHGLNHAGEEEYGYTLKHKDLDRIAQTQTQGTLALLTAA